MVATFPKHYDFASEASLYRYWESHELFDPEVVAQKRKDAGYEVLDKHFMVPLPPPNVTGKLHIGHAMMVAVEDVLVRYHRMNGYKTLWVPGTDHAAISTNRVVERKLKAEGKNRFDLGRAGFLDEVRTRVGEHRGHITNQLKRLGASLDWQKEQYTMSESLSRSVRKAFKTLYQSGKVYEDFYVVNRSPGAESVVSDIEVDYKDEEEKLYFLRYFVDTKKHVITIATTRPETMFGDVAIAVHPLDKRYKKFLGKKVIIPIVNRTIPIVADEDVDMTFGTGALKITPAHDPVDFELAKKHNLPLDVYAFDKDEIFTAYAGELFAGKPVHEFKDNVIQYLNDIGNLDRVESYTHRVPYCERTGTRIQPMLSKQWFMRVKPAAEKIMYHFDEDDVGVYPERFVKIFADWLEKIRPWCISRQIWRGHRMPVWYDQEQRPFVLDEQDVVAVYTNKKEENNLPFAMMMFNLVADSRLPQYFSTDDLIDLLFSPSLTPQYGSVIERYIDMYHEMSSSMKDPKQFVAFVDQLQYLHDHKHDSSGEVAERLVDLLDDCFLLVHNKYGYSIDFALLAEDANGVLKQSNDTLDTWFSSALWPFSILGWPEKTQSLADYYPNSVLETGYDIILPWVIKMMIMGVEIMGTMPFDAVYLHGLVRDESGKKMSKSIGNVVNPLDVIDQHGSDALRLSLLIGSTPGNDINYSDQKTAYYARFVNKLWNASRFVAHTLEGSDVVFDLGLLHTKIIEGVDSLHDFDLWILHALHDLIDEEERHFDKFALGEAAHEVVQTVWEYFCDWYIEISKIQSSPLTPSVLAYSLGQLLQLLHPFAPFVTEQLWHHLGFPYSISYTPWPQKVESLPSKNYRIKIMMEIITQMRHLRTQVTKKGHEKVDVFVQGASDILDYMKEFEDLVKKLVNIHEVAYFREGQEKPEGYVTGLVINITVGVKGIFTVNKQQHIVQLQKELEKEEQFLQVLRHTLSNESFRANAGDDVIASKEKKMEEVKSKITALEGEIKRLKS